MISANGLGEAGMRRRGVAGRRRAFRSWEMAGISRVCSLQTHRRVRSACNLKRKPHKLEGRKGEAGHGQVPRIQLVGRPRSEKHEHKLSNWR